MTYLYSALKAKEQELLSLLNQAQTSYDSRKDKLVISTTRNHYRYKIRSSDDSSARDRLYVTKDKLSVIPDLAQNDYLAQLIPALQKQLTQLQKYLKHYNPQELTDIYAHLHPARKTFVTPLLISDEDYITSWKAVSYEGNPMDFGSAEFYTESGIRVRSKSEIIIADRLDRSNIPYRYEFPLVIDPTLTIYPDFTILNPRTLQVYYWEHFGCMHNPEYVKHSLSKMNYYSSIGILTGKNLILTMEGPERPLNAKAVIRIIEDCLL